MNNFTKKIPTLLMILFEIIVGILLLVNPEGFTRTLIICFGILMLIVGVFHVVRFFKERSDGIADPLAMVCGVAALIIGVICAFMTGIIMGLFSVLAMIWGIVLIISDVYKVQTYRQLKQDGIKPSVFYMISAVAAIVLGVIVVFNPFSTTMMLWQYTGIVMIVEAVLDVVALAVRGK